MKPVILKDISFSIDELKIAEVLGRMGSGSEWKKRVAEHRIDDTVASAFKLVEPTGIYIVTRGVNLKGPSAFDSLEEVAVCVCTIGRALEGRVSALSAEGSLLEAITLDAAGSVAVESVADYIDRRIARIAWTEGKKTSLRASPGYGDWSIEGQRGIFDLLPAEQIGVTLSPGMMMSPRKSVSFAKHIAEDPVSLRSEKSCGGCGEKDCPYRG